jgi:hypothetical protein
LLKSSDYVKVFPGQHTSSTLSAAKSEPPRMLQAAETVVIASANMASFTDDTFAVASSAMLDAALCVRRLHSQRAGVGKRAFIR